MLSYASPTDTARPSLARSLAPLAIDVGAPLAVYFAARGGFGASTVLALTISSVVPLVRSLDELARHRRLNPLALLMLAVNVAGIALTFISGDPRVMLAKNSGVSSVVAISFLVSAFAGRPLTTAGVAPWVTHGDGRRAAAFARLSATSAAFQRLERRICLIWGAALLTECALRIAGAFTLAPSTMAWLSDVLLVGAIAFAVIVGGGVTVDPMERLIDAELEGR